MRACAMFLAVVFGFLCMHTAFSKAGKKAQDPLPSSFSELLEHRSALPNLSKKEYTRFVVEGPRTYHTIVLAFPMNDPRFEVLKELGANLKEVSKSYEMHLSAQPEGENERKLAFVAVDTSKQPNLLQEHGVGSPLAVFVVSPTKSKTSKPARLTQGDLFDFRGEDWSTHELHSFVTRRTRVKFVMHEKLSTKLLRYKWHAAAALGAVLALGVLVLFFKNFVGPFHGMFWYWVCMAIWMCVFGGAHFCILRGTPFMMFHPRTKEPIIFHPQGNAQFFAEGLLVTSLELTGGLLLVCLTLYYPKMEPGWKKRLSGYILVALQFAAVYGLRKVHQTKQGW